MNRAILTTLRQCNAASSRQYFVRHGSHLHQRFNETLNALWHNGGCQSQLGLAISGGVDSMALARLCSDAPIPSITPGKTSLSDSPGDQLTIKASFTAFIVNHHLRQNSDEEAVQVASELGKMGIESEILNLDWSTHGDPRTLTNFESVARTLRYQALGKACARKGISSLFLAHHQDDQAETVLLRMATNYLGTGLTGMRGIGPIPECEGLYGVAKSGLGRAVSAGDTGTPIEHGGVNIFRPLLDVKKEELIDFCRRRNVRWFEDATNMDPKLTLRNAIRSLQRDNVLPIALRSDRMIAALGISNIWRRNHDLKVRQSIAQMSQHLDVGSGTLRVTVPSSTTSDAFQNHYPQAMLLRYLIETVTPKANIDLQTLLPIVGDFFDESSGSKELLKRQAGGVSISRLHTKAGQPIEWLLHRAVPSTAEKRDTRKTLWPPYPDSEWSRFQLWDGRFWISICPPQDRPKDDRHILVRFLTDGDIASLRKGMAKDLRLQFDRALRPTKGNLRFTLPAIVSRERLDATKTEQVVALPSLGWCAPGWARAGRQSDATKWRFDIRYRQTTMRAGPEDAK